MRDTLDEIHDSYKHASHWYMEFGSYVSITHFGSTGKDAFIVISQRLAICIYCAGRSSRGLWWLILGLTSLNGRALAGHLHFVSHSVMSRFPQHCPVQVDTRPVALLQHLPSTAVHCRITGSTKSGTGLLRMIAYH